MKWLPFALCFLFCVGAVSGEALQVTDEGRTTEAAFSPDGSQVAYVRVEKHFTPEGRYYFSGCLYTWDGQDSRILANLPAGEPTVGDPSPESGPAGIPAWLPSGDYIVLAHWRGSTLFRIE
ncbi:MAG: PD40 domain-containing protein, partial [Armatimonadetes bacterium]|nr:PD40 domain-containing protein [Armatimonadota bacterium]